MSPSSLKVGDNFRLSKKGSVCEVTKVKGDMLHFSIPQKGMSGSLSLSAITCLYPV